jgi:uncharacterized protein (UPF0276 family)
MLSIRCLMTLQCSASIPAQARVGLRSDHFREILNEAPPIAWMEAHPENYFMDGGMALCMLEARL